MSNDADITYWKVFPGLLLVNGYEDGYVTIAPVMAFKPPPFGLYDLGGNVWEMCEDLLLPSRRADASEAMSLLKIHCQPYS